MDPKRKRKAQKDLTVELTRTSQSLAMQMLDADPVAHCLVIMGGMDVGMTYRVTLPITVAGRDPDSDLVLRDDGISRRHASFHLSPEGCALEDMGSTNGVFVNGAQVARCALKDGDKILLGRFTILKYTRQDEVELQYQQKLEESLSLDGLTGALNRRSLEHRLNGEWSYAARHRTDLSVLMIDVDHFKKINDTHGHAIGDEVLRALSRSVMDAIRVEDVFGRYGGEEFIVIARGIGHDGAIQLADRIRVIIGELELMVEGTAVPVTISTGVATAAGEYGKNPTELVTLADKRLYQAKNSGRNRCVG